ncbi:MAG: hypothetical protein IJ079_11050 [Lachnospiraceae bacterium]|nr:hypothetical protein [Lachnospiraceae bacterium]MBR1567576.1 hypothetical protein [Lachnospiraceae bacterium]
MDKKEQFLNIIKSRIEECERWQKNHQSSGNALGSAYEDVKVLMLERIYRELSECSSVEEYLPKMEQAVIEAEQDYDEEERKPHSDMWNDNYHLTRCMSRYHTYRDLYAVFSSKVEE